MVRVQDIQAVGISRATIYYRARKLGLDGEPGRPLRFTKEEVRRILAYKPERSGRKRLPAEAVAEKLARANGRRRP